MVNQFDVTGMASLSGVLAGDLRYSGHLRANDPGGPSRYANPQVVIQVKERSDADTTRAGQKNERFATERTPTWST